MYLINSPNREIEVLVNKEAYILDCTLANAFIATTQSFHVAKGTMIGIVPKTLLKRKRTHPRGIPEVEHNPQKLEVDPQESLFK